ncbi:MAG: sialate O-acetylesterase [Verrucomicrobiales bacterium]|jgi:sialate O-acetylesterase
MEKRNMIRINQLKNGSGGLMTLRWFGLAIILCAVTGAAHAKEEQKPEFRFARILSDGMVLQQEKPIKIWGWAKPDTQVAVTLTQDAATGTAAVEAAVQSGTRKGVAGKSSDDYAVSMRYEETNPPKFVSQSVEATAGADGKWTVTLASAKASFQATWIIAKSSGETLAVENVLIGEVWVCAGQSNMGWGNFNRKDRVAASSDFPGMRYVAWHDSYYKPLDDVRSNIRWQECSPEAAKEFSAVPYLYGMFLHRYLKVPVGIINVARGGTTGDTWCLREELDGLQHITVKESLRKYDAETAIWDKPAEVKRIMAAWEQAVADKKVEHEKAVASAKAEGKKEPRLRLPKEPADPRSGWSPPAALFNATVVPIRHLGVRGVLYYQGENNVFGRWTRYEHTFAKVPVSFRKAFGDENLPFGCISQPGWGTFGTDPELETVTGGYAMIRDIQRRALKGDPNAGMIATYPTGNSYIHPGEKFPVAEYASLWSLAKVYDQAIVHRGNQFEKMVIKDGKAYVYFDSDPVVYEQWKHIENNASWQVLPQPRQGRASIEGFIIAGNDRRWYPAKAQEKRVDGTWTIEVLSDLVAEPVAVRYGWANWPTGNLVGRERLPVPTFRTDDWPIVEGVSYSEEAKKASDEKIRVMQEEGKRFAFDRKLRQLQIDLPKLETDLYKGDAKKQLESKLARIETILDELQKDPWLSKKLEGSFPTAVEKVKAIRNALRHSEAHE